ncbi:50S ribosome-binding GTPase [Vibrio fluvialis]|uniref:GTPase n=1 Tax=Vibrio fluvialis TaxID=676 RepID=UPI001C9D4582|nr:GTPase [Vibrio fluvialis]MBY8232389.1 50S ribosome-binding GTPase [Vibrio fluvialis]MCE7584224.1 50S ribosome-binding GTPase [Vibrio fluvialis]
MPQSLSEVDVLQRALAYNPEEVLPILEYLKLSESECQFKPDTLRQDAQRIAWHLRKAGSNTLATTTRMAKNKLKEALGKDTDTDVATYREVVLDVAKKVKAEATPNDSSFISQSADSIVDAIGGITSNTGAFVSGAVDLIQGANYEQYSTEELEKRIIEKLFVDAYEQMSQSERDALFRSLGMDHQEIPVGASSMLLIQLLLKKYGGFAVYKYSIIVAHWIGKAIIGKGLPFAASPIIARAVSSFLGPVGWTASGLWAATALAGPAYRKTIPAVVHIAALRQLVLNRINIGVVGDGSVGKDAFFNAVFGLDTQNVDPIAGATSEAELYPLDEDYAINLINFPGFNDINPSVNSLTHEHLHNVDIFVMVIDLARGVSDIDVQILNKLTRLNKPIVVCLNKVDMVRPRDLEKLRETAKQRLTGVTLIETAFDPDDRIHTDGPVGTLDIFNWLKAQLETQGKDTQNFATFSPEYRE